MSSSAEPNPYSPPEAPIGPRVAPVPRSAWPWWVKLSLLGITGRRGLVAFVALSLAGAVGCLGYGVGAGNNRVIVVAVAFLVSALMYWLPLRWIDQNGSWARGI